MKNITRKKIHLLLACMLCSFVFMLTGCYRMPEDGEVSTLPHTNNPTFIRKDQNWSPGVDY